MGQEALRRELCKDSPGGIRLFDSFRNCVSPRNAVLVVRAAADGSAARAMDGGPQGSVLWRNGRGRRTAVAGGLAEYGLLSRYAPTDDRQRRVEIVQRF